MKKSLFRLVCTTAFGLCALSSTAQLYVPSGNVLSSQNSNVGIGVQNPVYTLDIAGPGTRIMNGNGNAAQLDLVQTNGGHDWAIVSWGNAAGGGTLSNKFSIFDNTSGGHRFLIDAAGNVGIGTTSPTSFGGGATLTEIHGTTAYGALLTSTNNVTGEIFASEGGEVYIGSRSAHPLQLAAGNIPRMTILMSGNIGIGTTNPTVPLEVFKGGNDLRAMKISMMPTTPGTHYSELQFGVLGDLTAKGAGVRGYFTNFTGTYASELRFFTSDVNNTSTENFVIKGDTGNVGIGTTNPTQKLSVNGTIRAKEVVVETSGWSDYVFADNYVLQPLAEVEAHIKHDRHLPGIPSAQQVAESGIELGEMQAKLLAKIEELTLHQIEQEKRFNEQKQLAVEREKQLLARIEKLEATQSYH